MIEKPETAPQNYTPEAIALWRVSLPALDQRTPASIAAARRANIDAVQKDLRLTSQAALVLSALGEIDAAFEITQCILCGRGIERFPSRCKGAGEKHRVEVHAVAIHPAYRSNASRPSV